MWFDLETSLELVHKYQRNIGIILDGNRQTPSYNDLDMKKMRHLPFISMNQLSKKAVLKEKLHKRTKFFCQISENSVNICSAF